MTILVDMDDVIERLLVGWVEWVNRRYGTHAVPDDVKNWDVSLAFPGLTHDQVYAATQDDSMWDLVPPMPGAKEALKQLMDEGHDIFIVTASEHQTLRAKMEKVLFRYFPFITFDRVIVTRHKQLIKGDVLIDDGPHNLKGGAYAKILFDASHNHSFDESSIGAVRVHNWQEALNEIHKLCAG